VAAATVALLAASWLAGRFTAGARSAAGNPPASSNSSGELGPVIGGPPPGAPFRSLIDATPGIPAIGVSQPTGDQTTIFVIRGQWWPAGEPVTVTLVGFGTSSIHPIADEDGSFNYAINQDHEFFAGSFRVGTFTIRVTDRAGASAQARIRVR
jgi:hypothetical protein